MTALLFAGLAPGWIILPAAAVLAYAYSIVKDGGGEEAGAGAAIWHMTWSVLGLAALGAVVWWVAAVA